MINNSLLRLIVGVCIGTVLAALLAGFASSRYYPLSSTWSSSHSGEGVFEAKCSGCHVAESGKQVKLGPSLADIGEAAKSRKPGMSAASYILESIMQPDAHVEPGIEGRMPIGTTEGSSTQDLRDLVAYLASRGAEPDYADIDTLDFTQQITQDSNEEMPSVATLQHGWSLFSEKLGCANCHSLFANPGGDLIYPSLAKVSNLSVDYIVESIRTPSKFLTPGYQQFSAETNSGEKITGRLLAETDETLEVLSNVNFQNFQRQILQKKELLNLQVVEQSQMPAFQLSAEDEMALVTFLKYLQAKVD